MQSTLKITDPSKYFPRTRRFSATDSHFFLPLVNSALRLCRRGIRGKEFGDNLPLLRPPTTTPILPLLIHTHSHNLPPSFYFSIVNRILLKLCPPSSYFSEKPHSDWKQCISCSNCMCDIQTACHLSRTVLGPFLGPFIIHDWDDNGWHWRFCSLLKLPVLNLSCIFKFDWISVLRHIRFLRVKIFWNCIFTNAGSF